MNKKTLILLLVFSFVLNYNLPIYASQLEDKKAVMFLINELSWTDITSEKMPFLTEFSKKSGIGLLNTSARGVNQKAAAYLALGSGVKLQAVRDSEVNFQGSELWKGVEVAKLYSKIKGRDISPENAVVPTSNEILNINEEKGNVGVLASELKKNNKRIAVLGNEDYDENISRFAPLVAMDSDGVVERTKIDKELNTLKHDLPIIFGTDYDKLHTYYRDLINNNDFLIIQLSDKERLVSMKKKLDPQAYQKYERVCLKTIDQFLEKVLSSNNNTLTIILNPYPSIEDREKNNSLTPIIMSEKGKDNQGAWLTSYTTKRAGIISNIDITPTILNYFAIKNPSIVAGHVIYNSNYEASSSYLEDMLQRLIAIHFFRPLIIKPYIFGIIVVLILVAFCLLLKKEKYYDFIKPLLIGVTIFPIVFLYFPITSNTNLFLSWLFLILVVGTLSIIFSLIQNGLLIFFLIYICTSLAIMVDLLIDAPFIKTSVLGYDPISGARYYGIGNEFMGVLIGATLMASGFSLEIVNKKNLFKRVFWLIYFLLTFTFISLPSIGTNVGGAITSSVGFITAGFQYLNKKINIRNIILLITIILAILVSIFIYDFNRPLELQSHIGQFSQNIMQNGLGSILFIFKRKILMNYKLIKYTIWSRVLLVSLAVMIIAFFQPKGILKSLLAQYPYVKIALLSTFLSSIIVLIVNDSGIVAAATLTIFIVPPMLYLLLDIKAS